MTDIQKQIILESQETLKFALIKRCNTVIDAIDLATRHRKIYPERAVEIWPDPDSKKWIVVEEIRL